MTETLRREGDSTRRMFSVQHSIVISALGVGFLLLGVASSEAQLVRYEGDFDVTLSVAPPPGMGGGGVTEADYSGEWALEYATAGTLSSGVKDVNRPLATFDMTPDTLFGVTYDTSNVEANIDYRGGGLFRFQIGGTVDPNASPVGLSSVRNDFRIEYRADFGVHEPNGAYEFIYGRSDGGPRDVLELSGKFREVEPDPYIWGEFDFSSGLSRFDRYTGRWALDQDHLKYLPFGSDESGTVNVPVRYFEITSDVPEELEFDQRDVRALLEFDQGSLREISFGVGNINQIKLDEPDFLISYLLWDDVLTYEQQLIRASYAFSDGQGNWHDGVGWADAVIVPEPASLFALAMGSVLLLKRNRNRSWVSKCDLSAGQLEA